MKIEIKSRWNGKIIFSLETDTLKLALEAAVKEGAYLKGADLKGAYLEGAYLEGADMKGADLEGAYLKGADLEGAYLEGAYLEGAYLEAKPEEGLLKKVAEAALSTEKSLDMGRWHSCDTTHCIAGWACTLSPNGKELENKFGTAIAAQILLGDDVAQHFYDSNVVAKAFLRRQLDAKA